VSDRILNCCPSSSENHPHIFEQAKQICPPKPRELGLQEQGVLVGVQENPLDCCGAAKLKKNKDP